MSSALQAAAEKHYNALPGKRGKDIPAPLFDSIFAVASGITRPLWGRPPTPHQMDHLHRNGLYSPEAIHAFYGALPHPHAPSMTVDQYQSYAHAYGVYQAHK